MRISGSQHIAVRTGTRFRRMKNGCSQCFRALKERLWQLGGTLSGGEQQMLAVARALMMRGVIMLLDEPSMGLSPILVQEIFKTIREINEDGTTVLLVEQNANMALKTASYGYVLQTGEIALHGPCRPGEFHPKPLPEPYVSLSVHTAPVIQSPALCPSASGRIIAEWSGLSVVAFAKPFPNSALFFCTSSLST
jgi:energy-coupling factor transporter ATP-binding protein EcfA2